MEYDRQCTAQDKGEVQSPGWGPLSNKVVRGGLMEKVPLEPRVQVSEGARPDLVGGSMSQAVTMAGAEAVR